MGSLVLGLLLGPAAPAMAESSTPIEIRWRAPAGCPQESDLRDRIQNLLGARRPVGHLLAEGDIFRTGKGFRLHLKVRVGNLAGTRSIESESCEDLVGAAAVELGLMIQSAEAASEKAPASGSSPPQTRAGGATPTTSHSEGTSEQPPQEPVAKSPAEGPSPPAETAAKPDVESETKAPPPVAESKRSWHALLQAPFVAVQLGSLPRPSLGGGLSLGLEYASWQWQLRATYWQGQSLAAPDLSIYGADVDRIAADLAGCREFRSRWVGISPCLTVGMERVSARGTGRGVDPSAQHATGMTVGAGLQGRLHVASWIRLVMTLGGHFNLSQPKIEIDGVGLIYRFTPAALTGAFGLEWIF